MKKVLLNTPMTYAGKNYDAGLVDMADDAAKSAVKRKFGKYADDDGTESKDFKLLSPEEAFERFEEGDASDEVFQSLKYYQVKRAEAKKAGISLKEYLEKEAERNADGGDKIKSSSNDKTKSDGGKDKSSEKEGDGLALSEDLPMRHVLAKLGEKYDSDDKIKVLSRADLIGITGIAEPSADKILAYFAGKK